MKSRFLNGWKWWRRHNIRDQIFMSMLFLTILAIGVLGTRIVSYGKNYDRRKLQTVL